MKSEERRGRKEFLYLPNSVMEINNKSNNTNNLKTIIVN